MGSILPPPKGREREGEGEGKGETPSPPSPSPSLPLSVGPIDGIHPPTPKGEGKGRGRIRRSPQKDAHRFSSEGKDGGTERDERGRANGRRTDAAATLPVPTRKDRPRMGGRRAVPSRRARTRTRLPHPGAGMDA
eukprot:scaffold1982_cov358-Pavlova_lutheri.AAC.17